MSLERAGELVESAESDVMIVGLGHAKVAIQAGINGQRDVALAAQQADSRIAALFERECGVPCERARERPPGGSPSACWCGGGALMSSDEWSLDGVPDLWSPDWDTSKRRREPDALDLVSEMNETGELTIYPACGSTTTEWLTSDYFVEVGR